jgi:hypothetical protein
MNSPMRTPRSLIFFLITAAVFALQAFPFTGIFLMLMMAPFWSVVLINAGMVGTGLEAVSGRVSRFWVLLPLAFYGGYFVYVASDRATLGALSARYAANNAAVTIPFDAAAHALVFAGSGDGGAWYVQNYDLPVAYTRNGNFPEKYLSNRMMARDVCAKIHENPALGQAFVHGFGFHDGEETGSSRMEERFCGLRMPERPELPPVVVSTREVKRSEATLPVTQVTTTVTVPGGRRYTLQGGTAAPLPWLPMPVMGCALNSGAPSWDCDAGFYRRSTPIVPGSTRYSRDSITLAEALGLKRVAIADRRGGDPSLVLAKMADVEASTLSRQLAAIDRMIADPLAKVEDWQVGVVASRPDVLAEKAEAIITGMERATPYGELDRRKARESGRILAGLVSKLPQDRFGSFGPRLLALYAQADDQHWLWDSEPLIRRLGDLGASALPYLTNRRASKPSVNEAGIEGLCRVGAPAKTAAEPLLLARWQATTDFNRDERRDLFVAMRRIGIEPPLLRNDKRDQFAKLRAEWGDIIPTSPPRVCATGAEEQARREERHSGDRRSNRS